MNSSKDYSTEICGISSTPNWWSRLPINSNDVELDRHHRIRYQSERNLAAPLNMTGTRGRKICIRMEPTDMDIFPIQEIELSEAEAEELDRLSRETRENGVSWESLKAKLGL